MPPKAPVKHNKLCLRCLKACKQPDSVLIVTCPGFAEKSVQLTIPLKFPPGRPKKLKR